MQEPVTVQKVYQDLRETLGLALLTSLPAQDVPLAAGDVHRPGMALMGFMENFLPHRLQVLGESELSYLATLDPDAQRGALERLVALQAPVVFVTRDQAVPAAWLAAADAAGLPVLRTPMATEEFIHELSVYLTDAFAPRAELHGSLVDVYGIGMLFTGKSGIGKSECALDLVERGHRLVADDIVEVSRVGDDVLVGRFREVLQHNLEIRGVGVIDVQAIFGIRGIRMQKRIEVEVNLQQWRADADYERMGLDREQTEILGVPIPRIVVPIYPGKNITVIAEVIALDLMLKIYGIDSAQDLNRRIMETLRSGDRLRRYLRHDRE
ncbi:MAG: HPr(Ser) kinase/phosphatase [Gemmatimonas sp.]|nr:HPr(Ser) kinase/phosphatase [Gemmatimonas sp.]